MIHSMTGYGKAIVELPHKKVTVEIKSLNSRQFDLYSRIPQIYREKEIEIRNNLAKTLERGKVDLHFNLEYLSKDVSSKIDHAIVGQYHTEIQKLSDELKVALPRDWFTVLLRLPDVMKPDIEELGDDEWKQIEAGIKEAVINLQAFRAQEGLMLEKVLRQNIESINQLLTQINPFEEERLERVKNRILDNLVQLENKDYDEGRLEQELVFYAERLDINEEKTRLKNHLDYFLETLEEEQSQGKKLGFITQEIGREINTLGAKSNHFEMQRIVVQMKDELEQIKEQILNIL